MRKILYFATCVCMTLILLASCDSSQGPFVINEVMPSNKTGILAADGKTHDWIEIRNVSGHTANLKGYSLEKDSGKVEWEFPDRDVKAGECVLVYATKDHIKGEMSCGFKIKAGGDSIFLVNGRGRAVSKAKYKKLDDDESLKLTKKGEYKKTFEQTPGFENNDEGREQYFELMESQRKDALKIWECENKSSDGVSSRYIEIKNTSNQPIDLTPYYICCDDDKPDKVMLPKQQLAPGKIVVVSDPDKQLKGDAFILMKNKKFVDGINTADTYLGTSIGRINGKKGFYFFPTPSLNAENTSQGYREVNDKPKFETKGGVYAKKSLIVKMKAGKATIHYTVDGTLPTEKSPILKDSIKIDTTTIIHAIAVDSTKMRSAIATATYLIGVKHTLPIVCVTVSDSDLYDYNTGIYVEGPGASPESPHEGANYWKPWEKCAHIEFFDGKDGFSYDCGLKIFGAYSRARDKKSFQIKFRRRYGHAKLKYDLYNTGEETEVKSFVLRSGSQDDKGTMVRDEFFTSLMQQESPTLHVQAYRPVILYLNGLYWGVYYIREKVNEEFVANHLKVDPKTATMLVGTGSPQYGTNDEYKALVAYIRSHSMNDPVAYNYMKSKIDFNSLIDYKIGEFYTGNCDVGNIRFFKSSDKRCNNKWHWLFYDLDWGFYYDTPLWFYIRENRRRASGGSLAGFNVFIDRLLANKEFRQLFLQRWGHHRNKTLSTKNALSVFNKMIETIRPEMEMNYKRWPQASMKSWEKHAENFRTKISTRPAYMDAQLQAELSPTAEEKKKYGL